METFPGLAATTPMIAVLDLIVVQKESRRGDP
jgi:hypothetical protein